MLNVHCSYIRTNGIVVAFIVKSRVHSSLSLSLPLSFCPCLSLVFIFNKKNTFNAQRSNIQFNSLTFFTTHHIQIYQDLSDALSIISMNRIYKYL